MKSRAMLSLVGLLIVALVVVDAQARGGRGGGGRGGGGRGGGGGRSMHAGGGRSAPSMSRSPSYNRGGSAQYGGRQPSAGSRQPSRSQAGARPSQQPNRSQAGNRAGQRQSGPQTIRNPYAQGGNRAGQQAGRGQAGNRQAGNPANRAGNNRPEGRPSQNDINRFLNISPGTGAAAAGGAAAGAAIANRDARPGNRDRGPGSQQRDQRVDNRQGRADTRQARRDARPNSPQDRAERRQDRAQNVRQNARHYPSHLPHDGFWRDHPNWARWRVNRPYRWATWGTIGLWYGLSGDGVYYDYGTGGNCYYEGDTVYYEGEPIATAEEYADQAISFAEAGAETIEQAVAADSDIEWMPLGVFALVHEEDGDPTFFMQLQIAKDGTISGTYTNAAKDTSQTIQGSVDKESQRAAWTVGENPNTVIETGLYNLTKDQAPALIHFGTEKTQEWLLVRMDDPDAGSDQ